MGIPELILIGLMVFIPLALIALVVTALRRAATSRQTSRMAQLEQRVTELEGAQKERP